MGPAGLRPGYRLTRRGWWALAVAVLVVGAGLAGGLVATLGGRSSGSPAPDGSAATASRSGTTRSAPVTAPSAAGTYQVASTTIDVVEPAGAAGTRSLPTTVWFPTRSSSPGRSADRVPSAYPLLVFSQGYDVPVSAFGTLIGDWASAGIVVAAPTYPRTDASDRAGLDENDIVNHPADLRAVISSVLARSQQPGSALSGRVDAGEIGLVGQSDGGDVSLAVAANACCRDSRVKAVAILSGAELASFGGSYFTGAPVPLLVVQGRADTVNPPGCSVQIYDRAPAPKYYLDLPGAGHLPPYLDAGADQQVVARVTTDFFDARLAGQAAAGPAMAADGSLPGLAQLSAGAAAPLPPGPCPGAPG